MRELRKSASFLGIDCRRADLLDMGLLYHEWGYCLCTVLKNDTLTYFGFGLREGSTMFSVLCNSFPKFNATPPP